MALRLLIRVDGGSTIGFGHLMRCIALGEAVHRAGGEVRFVCRSVEPSVADVFTRFGFSFSEIPDPSNEHEDVKSTLGIATSFEPDAVLVDHYGLGADWWRAVRSVYPVIAIDDLGRKELRTAVDLVLNYNPAALSSWYPDIPHILIGPTYALLREEFIRLRYRMETSHSDPTSVGPHTAFDILVSMGGSDPMDFTRRVVEGLLPISPPYCIAVLVGPGYRELQSLKETIGDHAGVTVLHQPPQVGDILSKSRIAVMAGGSSLYECACLGVPTIALLIADNQEPNCRTLHEERVIRFLGRAEEIDPQAIRNTVQQILESPNELLAMSRAGRHMVDGNGADRVAQKIRGLFCL